MTTGAASSSQYPFVGSDGKTYTGVTSPTDPVGALATSVFTPFRSSANVGQTIALTVGTAATSPGAPFAAPASGLPVPTTIRVRNAAGSTSPVTFCLGASTLTPTIPTPYTAAGTGGTPGDVTIDPGGVETIGLSVAQQALLAAGTLCLSAICATGTATLSVTLGYGT